MLNQKKIVLTGRRLLNSIDWECNLSRYRLGSKKLSPIHLNFFFPKYQVNSTNGQNEMRVACQTWRQRNLEFLSVRCWRRLSKLELFYFHLFHHVYAEFKIEFLCKSVGVLNDLDLWAYSAGGKFAILMRRSGSESFSITFAKLILLGMSSIKVATRQSSRDGEVGTESWQILFCRNSVETSRHSKHVMRDGGRPVM